MTRSLSAAVLNGAKARCPRCGKGALFTGFLTTNDACGHCGLELSGHRADDAPPYVVMLIVGHVVVGLMLSVEQLVTPPLWVHGAIWLPLTLAMSLALLRPVKGALVGVQWANAMHGFSDATEKA